MEMIIDGIKKFKNKLLGNKGNGTVRNMAHSKWTPFYFLFPAILVVSFVVVFPLAYEFILSFKNITVMNLISPKGYPFTGLDNYAEIFNPWYGFKEGVETTLNNGNFIFYKTLLRTIVWTFLNVFFHVVIGLFLAIVINKKLPGKGLLRVLLILPWAIPQPIVALTWRGMFNYEYGAVNILLTSIFGSSAAVPWLSDPTWSFVACIITNIWLGFPFMMMISLGGLQSIPKELYEAADIDGASPWQQFKNITLPLLKPVLSPAIVLGTVWTFNMVNIIYIMTYGAVSDDSQILISLVYRRAFNYYKYGYSAALSVVIFVILLSFSHFFIKAQKLEEVE